MGQPSFQFVPLRGGLVGGHTDPPNSSRNRRETAYRLWYHRQHYNMRTNVRQLQITPSFPHFNHMQEGYVILAVQAALGRKERQSVNRLFRLVSPT